MAIKEKITRYNEDKKEGYTQERVFIFKSVILEKEGKVRRLENAEPERIEKLLKDL